MLTKVMLPLLLQGVNGSFSSCSENNALRICHPPDLISRNNAGITKILQNLNPQKAVVLMQFFPSPCTAFQSQGCLPFDRKIRLGCRKHYGKRFASLP